MHRTLMMVEKMDDLLDETEEYINCAIETTDCPDLKETFVKLAKCHYDGYENMMHTAERIVEDKVKTHPHGETVNEMMAWHKKKFHDRAHKLKIRLAEIR